MVIRESVSILAEGGPVWHRDIEISEETYAKIEPPVYDKWLPPEPKIIDPEGNLWFKYERIS